VLKRVEEHESRRVEVVKKYIKELITAVIEDKVSKGNIPPIGD
jgi:hypothetical protein